LHCKLWKSFIFGKIFLVCDAGAFLSQQSWIVNPAWVLGSGSAALRPLPARGASRSDAGVA
jgi:hypothetical protein